MLIRRTGRNSDPTQKPCQRASLWFRQNNPIRGADAVIGLMRSVHFDAQGFTRTYWDFFSAFALFSPSFVWSRQLSQTTWRGSQRDQLNFRRQGRQGDPSSSIMRGYRVIEAGNKIS